MTGVHKQSEGAGPVHARVKMMPGGEHAAAAAAVAAGAAAGAEPATAALSVARTAAAAAAAAAAVACVDGGLRCNAAPAALLAAALAAGVPASASARPLPQTQRCGLERAALALTSHAGPASVCCVSV